MPNSAELLVNLIALSALRKEDGKVKEFAERLLKLRPQSRAGSTGTGRGRARPRRLQRGRAALFATGESRGGFAMKDGSTWASRIRKPDAWNRPATRIAKPRAFVRTRWKPTRISASVLQERGDLAGARRAYERVLDQQPDLPGALWNLALAGGARRQSRRSRNSSSKSWSPLKPDFEDAAFRLGFLQLQRGEYASAVDSFETCLKKSKDWVDALLNLGLAVLEVRRPGRRVRNFRPRAPAAAEKHRRPARADRHRDRAQGSQDRRSELHQKLTALGERSVELSYNLGLLLQAAGENKAAADAIRSPSIRSRISPKRC